MKATLVEFDPPVLSAAASAAAEPRGGRFPSEGISGPMSRSSDLFEVYETGKVLVIGFGRRQALSGLPLLAFRDRLLALADQHNSDVLAIDLTGVDILPSGMLGMLASLRKLGFEVYVFNPSPETREVLAVTQLDKLLKIGTVDLPES